MTNQYESIGVAFQDARRMMPITQYLEAPSVMRAVGPLSGKTVVDFACGEGFFTRIWKRLGGGKVVGVDLSPEMVDLALQEEARAPLGIEYLVGDASHKRKLDDFDVATAIFLFNYADDVDTLARMAENVAHNLTPGGRLVAVVPNPEFVNGREETRPYGYFVEEIARRPSSSRVRMTFTGDKAFAIEFTQWDREVYEQALGEAGFADIGWSFFSVSDEGISALGEEFWRATLENPKSVILSAVKR